jgi:hypothetical protein
MSFRKALLAALLGIASSGWAQQAQLPLLELFAGMHRIEAELAATPESRQIGMMQRTLMAPQRGMLFVFPKWPSTACGCAIPCCLCR